MIRKKNEVTNITERHYQNINFKELNNTGITYGLKRIFRFYYLLISSFILTKNKICSPEESQAVSKIWEE